MPIPAEDDEGNDGLTGHFVVGADDSRLGDLRVAHEGRLDLDRGQPVPRDVHDVVEAAEDPHVPVLVDRRPVAGDVVRAGAGCAAAGRCDDGSARGADLSTGGALVSGVAATLGASGGGAGSAGVTGCVITFLATGTGSVNCGALGSGSLGVLR